MATGFFFDLETTYAMETLYSGETAVYLLCTGAAWGKAATIAQVIASELPPEFGYNRASQVVGASAFENANQRTVASTPAGNFTASGGPFSYDAAVMMIGASLAPSRLITSCDVATNTLTCAGHQLVNNEPLLITTDAPGSNPGGISATSLLYAIALDPNTFQVASAPGGAAIDITSPGSIGIDATRLRYAKGRIVGAHKRSSPRTVFDGETVPIPFTLATMNAGFGMGV